MSEFDRLFLELKNIHPDCVAVWIDADSDVVSAAFSSGSVLERQEFRSDSETYRLLTEMENVLRDAPMVTGVNHNRH